MATSPISVTNPAGWHDTITHFPNVPTNGYAIQWVENSAADAIAPGDSLIFKFTSADTPAQSWARRSSSRPRPCSRPSCTRGLRSQGDSEQFLVTTAAAVPEPSSLSLGLVAIAGPLAWRRLRRRAKG